jgi:predicted O-methyltransferase YrrM
LNVDLCRADPPRGVNYGKPHVWIAGVFNQDYRESCLYCGKWNDEMNSVPRRTPVEFPAIKPEVARPSAECPNPSEWTCYDGMATEVEVLEFLGALIRMLRPTVIIETGTYKGYGTAHLCEAALESGSMVVHSAETDRECHLQAKAMLSPAYEEVLTLHRCDGEAMILFVGNQWKIDFAFLDSAIDTRVAELRALLPRLSARGVIAVHDTSTTHAEHKGPRYQLFELAKEHGLQIFQFDTPRGLTLLRK